MLLAVDTSTLTMGLALYDGAQVIAESLWQTKTHHTIELAPAVDDLLKRCGVKPVDLTVLACALGPGSFTSLRIGLAFTKGLALSLKVPLLGIPTLDFLVASQPLLDCPLVAVLPAGRSRLAAGWYHNAEQHWVADGAAAVVTAEELSTQIVQKTYICGEIGAEERQTLGRKWKNAMLASPAQCVRHPSMLAELAWNRWQTGAQDEPVSLAPIYIHIAEAIPD